MEENLQQSFSSATSASTISESSIGTMCTDQTTKLRWPSKKPKTSVSSNSSQNPSFIKPSSSPVKSQILNFETSISPSVTTIKLEDQEAATSPPRNMQFQLFTSTDRNRTQDFEQGTNKRRYSSSVAQDHIMAERKRRENLNLRFVALSSLVPGLKKMDKAFVLGGAIVHVKQLQERVKVLEEQNKKRSILESVILVKKSLVSVNDDDSLPCEENTSTGCSDGGGSSSPSPLPEIEARVSGKDVLIRIQCKKQEGVLAKIMREIENLHLSVMNSNVLQFGNSTLDITIISQMDTAFSMTVDDLVKNLRLAFLKYM